MARLRIPTIGASLPVFHGTSDETLERGVGHLQGSALPVGGAGTNSVLTGHSGIPQSRLFTDLHDLVAGDLMTVEVVGETLTYQVDRIDTVLPTETDLLQPVPGADLLTLVTCTLGERGASEVGVEDHTGGVDHRHHAMSGSGRATEGPGQQHLAGRRVLSAGRRRSHLGEDVLEHPLQQGSAQCRRGASGGAGAQERIHRGNLPADVDGHRAGSLSLAVALPPSGVVPVVLR